MQSKPLLVTAGQDNTIRLWNPDDQQQLESITVKESQTNCLAISPNAAHLAVGGYQTMRIFDVAHPVQPIQVFNVHERNVTTMGFNHDGSWIFTGGEDFKAKVWDLRSNSIICQRILQLGSSVNSIVLHPNQRELLVADSSGGIYIWDIRTNRDDSLTTELSYTEFIVDLDIDKVGKQVAAITNKGSCFLYSNIQESMLTSDQTPDEMEMNAFGPAPVPVHVHAEHTQSAPVIKFKPHNQYGLKCKFSAEGDVLATSAGDDFPKIWTINDKDRKPSVELKRTLDCEDYKDRKGRITSKWIWGLAFSENSNLLYVAGSDGHCRGFTLDDGVCARRYSGHTKGISALAFHNPYFV